MKPPHSTTRRSGSTRPASGLAQDGERLSKRVMALAGCSRSEAENYIEGGWVKVDGVTIETPALRVQTQTVSLDPHASLLTFNDLTFVLNKPPGWSDGQSPQDPQDALKLLLPRNRSSADDPSVRVLQRHMRRLQSPVPLETAGSGLLVFTQDWRCVRKLQTDLASMEHEFMVDVRGTVSDVALQRLARALNTERAPLPSTHFSVSSSTPEQSQLRLAVKGAHPGLAAHLCETAGLEILALRRIRLGRVQLGRLAPGQWRCLGAHERF